MAKKIRGRNEGSIFRRCNGTWRAQITLNGKRISYGSKTKAECQAWLRRMQFQLDQGYDYQGGKISLEEHLHLWLDASKASLRPNTAHQYGQIIRMHIVPYIGGIQIKDLQLARVEQFYGELINIGVGIRTVRLTHAVLHRALARAVRYRLITHNPAHGASLPRYQQGEMQVLDITQIGQFLVAANGSHYEALYHLAVTAGLRQGELFGLKWSDLKWNRATIHVQRQVQRIRGQGWSFVEPKTKAGRRTIKLSEGTLQGLREHKERLEMQKDIVGERWKDYDLIFPSTVGTPGNRSNMRVDFLRVLEKAGLPKIRFHDLRHTCASVLLNHGLPVIVVSNMLGHSKPSITLDIYGHLSQEKQSEAARIMDELVVPIPVDLSSKVDSDTEHL